MLNFFARQAVAYRNQMNAGCSELLGMAEGLLADGQLRDEEIVFLKAWLQRHDAIACEWPGDLIYGKVQAALADGVITPDERAHLIDVLTKLVGGRLSSVAEAAPVNQLAFDETDFPIPVTDRVFCLTGDFACLPRAKCETRITELGGTVKSGVSKKLHFLLVGALGSDEWKHGSYGTKIAKAIELKRAGCPILILPETALPSTFR